MTVRFVADEHIARALITGLRRESDDIDIVRVQDVGLRTMDDPTILQWAADRGRVLVTHDIRTMPEFANQRVSSGLPMAGVIIVPTTMPMGAVIEELAVILGATDADEWVSRVVYLPLR
ncbi:MAG: DUF5615 family PIN-like protein [Nocardioides sp.]